MEKPRNFGRDHSWSAVGSMELPTKPLRPSSRGAMLASFATAAVAGLVLLGWSFDIEVLKRIVPGIVAMNPISAVTFLIAAFSLGNFARQKRGRHTPVGLGVGRAAALLVALVGASRLIAIVAGHDLHFDQWLFTAKIAAESELPNTIAPNTALNFVLIGCALFFLQVRSRRVSASACIFALVTGFEALLVIIGYTYRVHGFYGVGSFIPMALHTAFCFAFLVVGIMSYQANRGFVAIILGSSAGGKMAQRLLPAAILVPAVLGWLRLEGQRMGFFSGEFGVALYTVTNMLVFAAIVCCNAYSLFRSDAKRTKSDLRLRRAYDDLEAQGRALRAETERLSGEIAERKRLEDVQAHFAAIIESSAEAITSKTLEGIIRSWNPAAEEIFGYTAEEAIGQPMAMLIPPDRADEEPQVLALLKKGGLSKRFEALRIRKDGEKIHVCVTISALKDANGKVVGDSQITRDITEEKERDEALLESRRQLEAAVHANQLVMDKSRDVICTVDEAGRFVTVSAASQTVWGYAPAELIGRAYLDLVYPDDRVKTTEIAAKIMAGDPISDFENRYVRKDGSLINVMWSAYWSASDEMMYAVAHDITERQRGEEEKSRLAKQIHLLLDSTTEGIYGIDKFSRCTFINGAGATILGHDPAALIGQDLHALIHHHRPDGSPFPAEECPIACAARTGTTVRADDEVFWRKDGTSFPVEYSSSPVVDNGVLRGSVVSFSDITARKEAQEALRESETRLAASAERTRLIVAHAHDAFVGMDANGLITDWNPQAEATFGWSCEEVIERPLHEVVIPPKFREMHIRGIKRFIETGEGPALNKRIELPALHRDGHEIPIEITISPIPFDDSFIFSAFLRDVSNRKRAQEDLMVAKEEAERANRAKSEFLSRMSHELRTPMNAILGFAELLALEDLNADQRDGLGHIIRGGEHLLQLINEVLDISRIESGRLSLSCEPVEIAEALREVIDLMQPLASVAGIRLDRAHVVTTYVLADRQRIKQVLINLVSNAIKYNRAGGVVSLTCELLRERARISVRDTGIGIPKEHIGQLFSPFERLGAEKGEIEGTGLGLTVTKRLVEAMNGSIGVQSKAGEGSTFWMEFALTDSPLVRSELASANPEVESIAWSEGATVLYIEDNFSNLKLIERLFRLRPGLKLIAARDGKSGLEMAREHQPALILLDLNLPDMNGRDVLTRLRTEPVTSPIPVITVSADATPGQVQRLMRAGAAGYLTKPIKVKKFLEVLDRALDARGHLEVHAARGELISASAPEGQL